MPEPENRVPDCFYMNLKAQATPLSLFQKAKSLVPLMATDDSPPVELRLTINFNEQWESVGIGRIKFGLSGGELRLMLTNGQIPYEKRHLKGDLALTVEKQRQDKASNKAQQGRKSSVGTKLAAKAESQFSIEGSSSQETVSERTESYPMTACQVTTKGPETEPAWVFEVRTSDPVLKGTLTDQTLATLLTLASDWQIQATFEVPLRDVRITDGEGLLLQNLTPEKRVALDIGLAKLLLKRKLQPYLSRMELCCV